MESSGSMNFVESGAYLVDPHKNARTNERAQLGGEIGTPPKGLEGFSKLNFDQRLSRLLELGYLTEAQVKFLKSGGTIDIHLAEKFIENVLGYFQLPLGIATHFVIDGEQYVIPMAVEETSIVAAASKTAKWIKETGYIRTETLGYEIIGQVQIAKVTDFSRLHKTFEAFKDRWVQELNQEVAASMVKRGGGVTRLELRSLSSPNGDLMAVIHVFMNAVDAMGANIMNQVCEYLKNPVEQETKEKVTMCILSNLVDSKITRAEVVLENLDPELVEKIEQASLFAEIDPYRAATHNKGVMNGIDPIVIATGNDWRAVEAGVHAYASRHGRYQAITRWRREGSRSLKGVFEAPIIVGVVGGVTQLHPMAKLSLGLLGNPSANRLGQIMAAVGLVQNLGALRALTTVGIIEGHMRLHIKNLSLGAGATEKEMPYVVKKLEEILSIKKRISLSHAIQVLKDLRGEQ
ncbi:MAG: hydroxymethylglutaryl-CoA reductase, degradative [Bdellovibrionaceae bacterium]|nr:hydroxymethylglutaryl-CoA reductase, degradative [Pseudobdellovibrionaceae bacterium]MDW8190713.1 hydroxymethylglutaryl-CoA reductase, degradative [Pseudobdellovibrionaceae bacterium]